MSDWKFKQRRKKKEDLRLKAEKRRKRFLQQDDDDLLASPTTESNNDILNEESAVGISTNGSSDKRGSISSGGWINTRSSDAKRPARKKSAPIESPIKLLREQTTPKTACSSQPDSGQRAIDVSLNGDSPARKPIDKKWLDSPRDRPINIQGGPIEETVIDEPHDRSEPTILTENNPSSQNSNLAGGGDSDSDESFDMLADFRKAQQSSQPNSPAMEEKQSQSSRQAERKGSQSQRDCPTEKTPPVRTSGSKHQPMRDVDDGDSSQGAASPGHNEPKASYNMDTSSSTNGASSPDNTKQDDTNHHENVPRNPIALMRQEQEKFDSIARTTVTRPQDEDDLWMDSDPEEEPGPKKTQTRKRRRTTTNSTNREHPTKNRKPVASSNLDDADALWDEDERDTLPEDEEALRSRLHPDIPNPPFGPFELKPLILGDPNSEHHQVPAALSRYLAPYQREGIEFMYKCLAAGTGCVMGDEMGLGKTLQVLSLLSALYRKSGTAADLAEIQQRKRAVRERIQSRERDDMLLSTLLGNRLEKEPDWKTEFKLPNWCPVLILVPPTLIDNWKNEFVKFSHFSVATYRDKSRETALKAIHNGAAEVLLTAHSTFQSRRDFMELNKIVWRLVIIDEFHKFKNEKGHLSVNLRELKRTSQSQIVGMTGTLMQNDHKELWNLVDLVETGFLGSWNEFKSAFSMPIKIGRTKNADPAAVRRCNATSEALNQKVRKIMIGRKKDEVLKDQLPEKSQQLVLCEPSVLQKEVYRHVLELPDFQLVKKGAAPCDCSVNAPHFKTYKKLKTPAERLEYYRKHKESIVKRKECCYMVPLNPKFGEEGQPKIDPDAALWRMLDQHADEEACEQCPLCVMFPCFSKLDKIANHLALVQPKKTPSSSEIGSPDYITFTKELEFAKVALPTEVVKKLPGASLIRKDTVMDNHFELSGKLKVLDKLLQKYQRDDNNKVLLFSFSTQTLDLIQNYVKSKGITFLRMDGTTNHSKRQIIADQFNSDPSIFLLLLSTKAMGLGLNLTSANKVIIFDVEWNPSWDEQAQDRAYRIGQQQDVQVVRLVSQGTVDELKYLRQLYKVQLKQETLEGDSSAPKAARMFRGVQGDKYRKGELFGLENLLKFKDGCFLDDIWKKGKAKDTKARVGGLDIHETTVLEQALGKLGEEKCEEILHEDTRELDAMVKKDVKASVNASILAPVDENEPQDFSGFPESSNAVGQSEIEVGAQALNHGDLFREDRGGAAVEMGEEGFDVEMGGASQNAIAIYEEKGVFYEEGPSDKEDMTEPEDVKTVPYSRAEAKMTTNKEGMTEPEDVEIGPIEVDAKKTIPREGYSRAEAKMAANAGKKKHSEGEDVKTISEEQEKKKPQSLEEGSKADTKIGAAASAPTSGKQATGVNPKHVPKRSGDKIKRDKPAAASLKINLMGNVSTSNVETTFSVADIPIPTYQKTKKKGGKKKRKRKDGSG